ncbi:MAG TPA: hypothetical protein VEX11_14760 [Acetobacteraceae bacterium]|nr:hypothetical protein [Acetobacteraceae bacterium]
MPSTADLQVRAGDALALRGELGGALAINTGAACMSDLCERSAVVIHNHNTCHPADAQVLARLTAVEERLIVMSGTMGDINTRIGEVGAEVGQTREGQDRAVELLQRQETMLGEAATKLDDALELLRAAGTEEERNAAVAALEAATSSLKTGREELAAAVAAATPGEEPPPPPPPPPEEPPVEPQPA